jgi:hypothetical protein
LKKKIVKCKWIFKRKEGMAPNEHARYKARSIHIFLNLVAMHNYELEQLDVKTAFLHGDLEEGIYMDQLVSFVVPGKEECV